MKNYDSNQGPLHATNFRTASLLAAILIAAAAALSCNLSENANTLSGDEGGGSMLAPVAGQSNGDLHSTLPDLHDLRRRYRDHHWTSALVVETAHHQPRSS